MARRQRRASQRPAALGRRPAAGAAVRRRFAAALERLRSLAETAPLRCVQVLGPGGQPGRVEHVRDPKGHLQGACHVFGHAWALVRPDSYVAATGESVDASLVHAVGQALGAALEEDAA
jgi:3-(3-hydroxy-phenyl)propionate hydroxylase